MPEFGKYATGIIYLDKNSHLEAEKDFETLAASLGIKVLCWRDVPSNSLAIGAVARKSEPLSRQVFVTAEMDEVTFKKNVFVLRKRATHELIRPERRFYICSLNNKTVVYKGLFTSDQVIFILDSRSSFLTIKVILSCGFTILIFSTQNLTPIWL